MSDTTARKSSKRKARKRVAPLDTPLRLVWMDPAELADNPANWREHPEAQVAVVEELLDQAGWAGACLNLPAKLALRRHFLRKYHADKPPSIIDCCMGSGVIWHRLRQEFEVASYWGIDLKKKKGRLNLDSSRVLAQPGWTQDVIDIDTYGSPWRHWAALLPNVVCPATVFLTVGVSRDGATKLPAIAFEALGLRMQRLNAGSFHLATLQSRLYGLAVRYLLTMGCSNGIVLAEAVEAVSDGHARYIGVRLKRERPGGNPAAAEHSSCKGA